MREPKKTDILAPKKANRRDAKATDEEIMSALSRTHGIIAKAAALISKEKSDKSGYRISITRQAVSERIKGKEKLRQAHDEAAEGMLDFAEDKLFQAIADSDMTAIIFYLKCKGKKRGYIERQSMELTGPDGVPLNPPDIIVNFAPQPCNGNETGENP